MPVPQIFREIGGVLGGTGQLVSPQVVERCDYPFGSSRPDWNHCGADGLTTILNGESAHEESEPERQSDDGILSHSLRVIAPREPLRPTGRSRPRSPLNNSVGR